MNRARAIALVASILTLLSGCGDKQTDTDSILLALTASGRGGPASSPQSIPAGSSSTPISAPIPIAAPPAPVVTPAPVAAPTTPAGAATDGNQNSEVLLYDLDFENYPYTPGDAAPLDPSGPLVRKLFTSYPFGKALTVNGYSGVTGRAALLRHNEGETYGQAELNFTGLPAYNSYCIKARMKVILTTPQSEFTFFIDAPQIFPIRFREYDARIFEGSKGGRYIPHGSTLETSFDMRANRWIIQIDGTTIHDGALITSYPATALRSLRFSVRHTGESQTRSYVVLDDIQVRGNCMLKTTPMTYYTQPTSPPAGGKPTGPDSGQPPTTGGGSGQPPTTGGGSILPGEPGGTVPDPIEPACSDHAQCAITEPGAIVEDKGPPKKCPDRTISLDPSQSRWFQTEAGANDPSGAPAIHTFWANQKLILRVRKNCKAGWHRLGVTARNIYGPLPAFYEQFQIQVGNEGDGTNAGAILIPADEKEYRAGFVNVFVPKGDSDFSLNWTNDAYLQGSYDANIQIGQVSLEYERFAQKSVRLARSAPEHCYAGGRWFFDKKSAWTHWSDQILGFCFKNVPAGRYRVVVKARNRGALPSDFKAFKVTVAGDGVTGVATVPAHAKKYQEGTAELDLRGGSTQVNLIWQDEGAEGESQAQMQVRGITLERIGTGNRSSLTAFLSVGASGRYIMLLLAGVVFLATMLVQGLRFMRRRREGL